MGPPSRSPPKRAWWKESSVYQIYPASFCDSTGTGTGDIPGIISKLDYLRSLNVDLVWLSPILDSPQVDMGYDISDYKKIYPPYGTLGDVDALIGGLHERGMKYVMDLVVNHTSDQHEWFKHSRSSKDDEYRDWYVWRPAKYDAQGNRHPPNNWGAVWGGSAWEWDETTQEYYLHIFAPEQPDLNWENPKVVEAVHDIVRFWLERGVDGFRMDVINFISKAKGLPDATVRDPTRQFQSGIEHYACGPRLHEFLSGLGVLLKEYDAFSVGEMPGVYDTGEILKAVGFDRGELAMVFHFEIMDMDEGDHGKFSPRKWKMSELKEVTNRWQTFMIDNDGWNASYIENHDRGRSISRFASDAPEFRGLASKMLATFLIFQSGTPFVYQGQELAQPNYPRHWGPDKLRDIESLNDWKQVQERYPNDKEARKLALEQYRLKSRDNARTPMQWNSSKNAGFSTADRTWMEVHDDFKDWDAEKQLADKDSPFHYWAAALKLRKEFKDILVYGDFALVSPENEDVFAFTRTFGARHAALVVCNFRDFETQWTVPSDAAKFLTYPVKISNYPTSPKTDGSSAKVTLRPFEAFVLVTSS